VARCLARDPAQRYASPGALAGDLRRHLAHLPLQGVANSDVRERWRKWRTRRPGVLMRAGLALLALVVLASSMFFWEQHLREQSQMVEQALAEGEKLLAQGHPDDAARVFHRGQTAGWFPGDAPLRRRLAAEGSKAVRTASERRQERNRQRLSGALGRLADDLRFFWDLDTLSAGTARTLQGRCAGVWEKRSLLLASALSERERNDLIELPGLWAQLEARLGGPDSREAPARALQRLDDVEIALGSSLALEFERQRFVPATKIAVRAPESAWEHYTRGRVLLRDGKVREAADQFALAVARQPDGFWPNFYQGVSAHRLHHDEEAVAAFRTCIALAPRAAPCYLNRALALLRLGRTEPARADMDRAIQLGPELADAWLQRGLVHAEARRLKEASSDLRRALALGADPARCHYNLAQVYRSAGDLARARDHARRALECQPGHAGTRQLLEALAERAGK
jgi:tetratricopeptide (TPR) repeat protein